MSLTTIERKYFEIVILLIIATTTITFFTLNAQLSSTRKLTKLYVTPASEEKDQYPPWASLQIIQDYSRNRSNSSSSTIPGSSTCVIPPLEPFDSSILRLVRMELPPLVCANNDEFPLLFNSTLEPSPRLVPTEGSKVASSNLEIVSCCFREIRRNQNDDRRGISLSEECIPLTFENHTDVPFGWEFVLIVCEFHCSYLCQFWNMISLQENRRVMDLHTFIHNPISNITTSNDRPTNGTPTTPPLNVIVLALDAMSRMSFLRTLPEIHYFLINNLSAVEMRGFNKIGENTFPNIVPMLTNREIISTKHPIYGKLDFINCEGMATADNCPFIWKAYSSKGYHTLFAEDEVTMSIFNFKRIHFNSPPTTHYFRPFAITAHDTVSHEKRSLSALCYGPRPALQTMLNYMEKMATSLHQRNQPFFQFAMSAITHEFVNGGRLAVNYLLEFLQQLHRKEIFNNTALIFLSDHGSRLSEFRSSPQGFLEDRLPFMYIALPRWFQTNYSTAFENLRKNAERLITARDIYSTLKDLLNPETNLGNLEIGKRKENTIKIGGKSLFLQIPVSRTCREALIPKKFCTCSLQLAEIPIWSRIVTTGVSYAVKYIHKVIGENSACAKLSLWRVLKAERVGIEGNEGSDSKASSEGVYRVVFELTPGPAKFEAMFRRINVNESILIEMETVGRLDLYEEQSGCVETVEVKPYCVCE